LRRDGAWRTARISDAFIRHKMSTSPEIVTEVQDLAFAW
jgi:hypothetical protein